MTKQEMFDKVLDHLRAQGKRSHEKGKGCLYRGPNGLRCAIGALIPDEAYDEAIDLGGIGVFDLPSEIKEACGIDIENNRLASDLQELHDDPTNWDQSGFNRLGEMEAKEIAKVYKLKYSLPA